MKGALAVKIEILVPIGWRKLWGAGPLQPNMNLEGIAIINGNVAGVILGTKNAGYVLGRDGEISALPQPEVQRAVKEYNLAFDADGHEQIYKLTEA